MRTSWARLMVILIDFLVRERLENLGKLQGEFIFDSFCDIVFGETSLCLRCVFVVCSLCVRLCIKLVY